MSRSQTRIRTRRFRKVGGFTLPETISVIVITGLVAATAAPALTSIGEVRSRVAARQALRDLTFARQMAVATGTRTWVVFDPDTQSWSILAENPAAPGRAAAAVVNDFATGRAYTQTIGEGVFHGVSLASVDIDSDVEIGFDWIGRPFNAEEDALSDEGTITFSGGYVLTIETETGHVRYIEP